MEKPSDKQVLHNGNTRETLTSIYQEGHFGVEQLFSQVNLLFSYPKKVFQACKEIAEACVTCQVRARPVFQRRNLASQIKTPYTPFFTMGCDAVGPLNVISQGNKYILRSVDYLPRWPMLMMVLL